MPSAASDRHVACCMLSTAVQQSDGQPAECQWENCISVSLHGLAGPRSSRLHTAKSGVHCQVNGSQSAICRTNHCPLQVFLTVTNLRCLQANIRCCNTERVMLA